MDRLPTLNLTPATVATLVTAVLACNGTAGAPPPRTNGAKVAAGQAATPDAFCDVRATDDTGAVFRWPELAGSAAPAAATGWRWVNVWATWCKPCIAEMPRLVAWRDELARAGKPIALTFVSADESDADIAAFRRKHPEAPPSLRMAPGDQRTAWLQSLHMGDGAIPIHLFVSPANRLRCGRAGEVREQDRGAVEQLLVE